VLDRDEDRVHIRFGSGQEGWIKASYLSSDPPLRQQLEERGQELDQLHKENAALQSRIAELQRSAATPPAADPRPRELPARDPAPPPPPAPPPAASDAPSQDVPVLGRGASEAAGFSVLWLIASALVALACGFGLGWRVLDRRIRKRYGGLRIY
jgi:hypothetical protein